MAYKDDWIKVAQNKNLYDSLTESNKKVFWEYGNTQGLVPHQSASDVMKAEMAKYGVNKDYYNSKYLVKKEGATGREAQEEAIKKDEDRFATDYIPTETKTGKSNIADVQKAQKAFAEEQQAFEKYGTPTSTVVPKLEYQTKYTSIPSTRQPYTTAPVPQQVVQPNFNLANRMQNLKESSLEPQKPTIRNPFNFKDTTQGSRGTLSAEAQRIALKQTPSAIAGTLGGIGASFGIKNTPEQEQYLRDTKEGYGAYSVGGQIIGNIAGYGAVNAALKGTKLGATLVSTLGKKLGNKVGGYVASQGVQLLADAIVQAPTETVEAIQNDKSIGEDVKQMLTNRAIDLAMNMAIQGGSDAFKKMMANKKVSQTLIEAGVNETDVIKAVETNDTGLLDSIRQKLNITPVEGETIVKQGLESPSLLQRARQASGLNPFGESTVKAQSAIIPTLEKLDVKLDTPKIVPTLNPTGAKNIDEVIVRAPQYKDVGTTERWTTDVNRVFEKVFGNDFQTVKKAILDPFDAAKKARVEDEIRLTDSLQNDVVKNLGIKKNSKESALTMRYGEKRIDYDGLVKEVGQDKANKIVKADEWFRNQYDTLIDEINIPRVAQGKEPIPKRTDYYRHYNEMGDTFAGIKNIFESNQLISPKLEGISEFTKPSEKWASFKQKRTGNAKFKEDAVGGFLDYVRAGTYAKHIDPQIKPFRDLTNKLKNATEGTKNMNNFVGFLEEYANGLSGKTNKFDRTVQDLVGRKVFNIANQLNSRIKSNAVLGNLSSSLSQIANVPQGIATVKDPVKLAQAMDGYYKSWFGGGDADLYKKSGFLKERLTDAYGQFDTRIIDQPKKLAQWTLGALDEMGSKFIWSGVYRKGLAEGVENPIKYADDLTRKLVGGRGIGETPILQQSKLYQMVAPFTLEMNNMWKVQKDFLKKKDFSALAILYLSNFALNKAMEEVRGSGVVFDPIDAIIEGVQSGDGIGDKFVKAIGSLAGEVFSSLPLGSSIASVVPEYGTSVGDFQIPSRQEIFGENDPTRFGVGSPLLKAAQDPVKNLLLPFGGAQVSKTIQGAQAFGLLPNIKRTSDGDKVEPSLPASVSNKGRLRTFVEPSPLKTAQALAFGQYASKEVRDFFKNKSVPYGNEQTKNIYLLVDKGIDPYKLDKALTEIRTADLTKKEQKVNALKKQGFTQSEIDAISSRMWGYTK